MKQKDVDGKSVYSPIIALAIDKSSFVFFYPNPVVSQAFLSVTVERAGQLNARVIDNAGRVLKQFAWKLAAGSTSLMIDVDGLSKGHYYLELNGEMISERISFVKQ